MHPPKWFLKDLLSDPLKHTVNTQDPEQVWRRVCLWAISGGGQRAEGLILPCCVTFVQRSEPHSGDPQGSWKNYLSRRTASLAWKGQRECKMERDRGKTPKFCWQDAVLEDSSTANICLLSRKKDESEGRTMSPESGAKSHRESFPSFGNKSRTPSLAAVQSCCGQTLSCISPACRRAMRPAPMPGHSHRCVLGVLGQIICLLSCPSTDGELYTRNLIHTWSWFIRQGVLYFADIKMGWDSWTTWEGANYFACRREINLWGSEDRLWWADLKVVPVISAS